jgi:hypothetical protein
MKVIERCFRESYESTAAAAAAAEVSYEHRLLLLDVSVGGWRVGYMTELFKTAQWKRQQRRLLQRQILYGRHSAGITFARLQGSTFVHVVQPDHEVLLWYLDLAHGERPSVPLPPLTRLDAFGERVGRMQLGEMREERIERKGMSRGMGVQGD